ncbi:cyclopropane fatty acyl phospholipid synthase [Legionella oakridgensis]|uniref:Cyclopropane fatty acid synthase-related methyltransferase n=2 Tax=Legionella oakridgensis TaxID=29423 RepID=W0BBT3_9GAMM|nr:cyclopropane fatty acyl phospholipid synthase [Legionella oakridgensis]AHE66087.1 cyclopropane fatty acid synthase-related methyltransferase [Legionella oakridgensis ATCC 33761 = DSM 21215]ETO94152.1 cyclopropane-fatty-acyl-phospholipid synthase [Legionella oakridgensis RV-2-2007]KTD43837.1 cyclopropane fatty acid synthase [Legionella oakridgensis]STY16005.1 cyclopropane fatty acid synthase [Legionella longbeachae]
MPRDTAKKFIETMLEPTGITINGNQPWDIQVHNNELYSRFLQQGSLGLGESYMDKWWDCERLDMFFDRILRAKLDTKTKIPFRVFFTHALAKLINFQDKWGAKQGISHYNIGNSLFKAMLDKNMVYSCGYYKEANALDEAQIAKLDLICKKLQLKPGMRLLDIGCGWGGFARYAAEHYNVRVVGVTISEQQYEFAKHHCKNLDVDIRLQDYRDIQDGPFDRIASIGMFEHVGHLNYKEFMQTINRSLVNQGLFLLHSIGVDKTASLADEWIRKYIFPRGMLPSIMQTAAAAEPFFVMEDWQNFGIYYDKTLMAWYQNFVNNWHELKSQFDERFYRMWTYYLLSCAGGFRARGMQLWQIVFSKGGLDDGYMAPR